MRMCYRACRGGRETIPDNSVSTRFTATHIEGSDDAGGVACRRADAGTIPAVDVRLIGHPAPPTCSEKNGWSLG